MHNPNVRRLAACIVLLAALAQVASAAEILIVDAKSSPESLTLAPGGIVIAGSASSPFIYRVPPGSTTAEKFVDASTETPGTFFLGMLADAATNTLWACQTRSIPGPSPMKRHSILRSFDLSTGAPKLRWTLPGDDNTCNDFSIGPDKALYISETTNGRIYRLPAGATTPDLYLENPAIIGVDGITFLNGMLYVDTVFSNKLFRIPVDAAGKPGIPVEISMDQPMNGPDGMRAANGKLLVAENRNGKIDALTVNGDKAHVTVIKEGLNAPTGVEPAGDILWISERGAGKVESLPMPK